jgi:dolichyl-diphosphooligosaccharide--protein glycosyltransferase
MLSHLKERSNQLLLLLVLIFTFIGLWIRLIPIEYLINGVHPIVFSTDPWFTVRQVEQIIPQFPNYAWFDPFLNYPAGKIIDWGPVFPLIASSVAIVGGASTHAEIIPTISWIPPICGLLLVPICFLLATVMWDIRAGWISAMLISVLGGETLFYTYYGDVDHHIFEVIFTLCFFIVYFYFIAKCSQKNDLFYKSSHFYIISIIAGVTYYLALMTMPTCSIIALIVGIIIVAYPLFSKRREDIQNFGLGNFVIFGAFIILYGITGIQVQGWGFSQYTAIHLLIAGIPAIISAIYFILIRFNIGKTKSIISGVGFFITAFVIALLYLLFPAIWNSINDTVNYSFFGFSGINATIQEMQHIDLLLLIQTFNIAILFALFGFILILRQFIVKRDPLYLGIFVWICVYLSISVIVKRYFYYGGGILVILCSIALSDLYGRLSGSAHKIQNRKISAKNEGIFNSNLKALVVVGVIVGIITIMSVSLAIHVAVNETANGSIDKELVDGLQYLKKVSPEYSFSYSQIYDKTTFRYPNNTYSVLGWWEIGHGILANSQRISVSSPFLENIHQVSSYYLSQKNDYAELLADTHHVKYVITTNDLLLDDFPMIQKCIDKDLVIDAYYFVFLQKNRMNGMQIPMIGMRSSFYNTMLTKLHVNDGSNTLANGSVLVDFSIREDGEKDIFPVMNNLQPLNNSLTKELLVNKRQNQEIISLNYLSPIIDTPALQNYRLIYESNGTRTFPGDVTLNNIKIFERVKGYTIPGTGTIEVPIVTNQGRHFTYRQQSVNGTFTLPYATTDSPYDVHATGPYRIIETNKTFDVDESQIEKYYT